MTAEEHRQMAAEYEQRAVELLKKDTWKGPVGAMNYSRGTGYATLAVYHQREADRLEAGSTQA